MTKILTQTISDASFTDGAILNMDEHLGTYIKMITCETLAAEFPQATVEILTSHPPDDYFVTGSMVVVSDRLKLILDTFAVKVEYFQLNIIYKGAAFTDRCYYFCHILDCVDCFDFALGSCTFHDKPGFTDRIDSIDTLVIDEAKASSHHLFRLGRGAEYIICVSDALSSALQAANLTGFEFVSQEDWRLGC